MLALLLRPTIRRLTSLLTKVVMDISTTAHPVVTTLSMLPNLLLLQVSMVLLRIVLQLVTLLQPTGQHYSDLEHSPRPSSEGLLPPSGGFFMSSQSPHSTAPAPFVQITSRRRHHADHCIQARAYVDLLMCCEWSEVGAFYWTNLAPDIVNSEREEQCSFSL
jgi:hypothetical protein